MTVRPFRAEESADGLPASEVSGSRPRADGSDFVPLPVIASGRYAKSLAAVLLAYKNHGHTDLVRWLQAALAGALHEANASLCVHAADVVLVPVPGKGASFRRRGYDPLALLLGGLARRRELPAGAVVVPAVRHARTPAASAIFDIAKSGQKGLGRRGRRSNVAWSMEPAPAYQRVLRGRACLIVDDVLTTGSTIAETARVLRGLDATVAGAVVIAATPAPRGRRERETEDPTG
nr:phosphoribosyltransferase family protein [Arthrobacter pigmenti]